VTQELKLCAIARKEATKDAINIVVTTNAGHRCPPTNRIQVHWKGGSRLVLKRTDYCGETKK
jgi:hypothetical protein